MLRVKPTEHRVGVAICGDYQDFNQLADAFYNVIEFDKDAGHPYYGVYRMLLSVCYDIRHAYMGDRDVELVDNGLNQEIMRYHSVIAPIQNVYYRVNTFFPLAVFVAEVIPDVCRHARKNYRSWKSKESDESLPLYREYLRDQAALSQFRCGVFAALAEVIGDDAVEKLMGELEQGCHAFSTYITHYVDKCNLDLIATPLEDRPKELRSIATILVRQPASYRKLEEELWAEALQSGCSIYQLIDDKFRYPDTIEW